MRVARPQGAAEAPPAFGRLCHSLAEAWQKGGGRRDVVEALLHPSFFGAYGGRGAGIIWAPGIGSRRAAQVRYS
jgi:hypothetical protein